LARISAAAAVLQMFAYREMLSWGKYRLSGGEIA